MLNRPNNLFSASSPTTFSADDWSMDANPAIRLLVLFAAIVVVAVVIAGRLFFVQSALGATYEVEFVRTTEKREPIPSGDGRILTAGGEVLAEDVEFSGIKVHYRWLEEPPDPRWLKQQALQRLDRPSRRKPELVAAEVTAALARRDELWQKLEVLTQQDSEFVAQKRRAIQARVEHIRQTAEKRRQQRLEALEPAPAPEPSADLWLRLKHLFVAAVTTPPEREALEPLVVQEELDYHLVVPEVSPEVVATIDTHPGRYPGVRIATTTRRVYPQGPAASHVLGYRAPIDAETLKSRREQFPNGDPLDYEVGDRVGSTGLEQFYERHLRGLRGERLLVLDRYGEVIRSEITRQPRLGRDLVVSLNLPLQKAAEALLDDALSKSGKEEAGNGEPHVPHGATLIALDVRTGAILAAAAGPRFDLGLFTDRNQELWQQTLDDPRKPFFPRITSMTLPPGSVFKVLSAVAYLESGRLDPEQKQFCQGFLDTPERYRCYTYRRFGTGHADVDLVQALARSCNVYFFSAARRIGPQPLCAWAQEFGFGQPTGVDLPGERGGNLPLPAVRRNGASGETLGLAIGQARLTVTPLQIARMMAAVANGGQLVTPHFAEGAGPARDGDAAEFDTVAEEISEPPSRSLPGLSPSTLAWVRRGLQAVVAHPQGTGYKTVRLKEVSIAGKTGTAESGGGQADHAWFAGYVPAENPRIAFAIVLEHAGSGGHAAGPVARKFVQSLLSQGLLPGFTLTQVPEKAARRAAAAN